VNSWSNRGLIVVGWGHCFWLFCGRADACATLFCADVALSVWTCGVAGLLVLLTLFGHRIGFQIVLYYVTHGHCMSNEQRILQTNNPVFEACCDFSSALTVSFLFLTLKHSTWRSAKRICGCDPIAHGLYQGRCSGMLKECKQNS
jgi:hypothetical protein